MEVENILFDIADALRVPVLVLAILALAVVIFELGGMVAELLRRRGRGVQRLNLAILSARSALGTGDAGRAYLELSKIATSKQMRDVLGSIVEYRAKPGGSDRIAKDLAEFDYSSVRKLERTRILVRVGPALGLMGTLIPLSPALAGLAEGDVQTLSDNLRVAFSVTVAGLLVGSIAFGISLVRDRIYGQDFSDLEYIAAGLEPGSAFAVASAPATQGTKPATPAAAPATQVTTAQPATTQQPASPAATPAAQPGQAAQPGGTGAAAGTPANPANPNPPANPGSS